VHTVPEQVEACTTGLLTAAPPRTDPDPDCTDPQASVLLGILFVTFISWVPGHGASYLTDNYPLKKVLLC
jgi:hypothetical protein